MKTVNLNSPKLKAVINQAFVKKVDGVPLTCYHTLKDARLGLKQIQALIGGVLVNFDTELKFGEKSIIIQPTGDGYYNIV